MQDWMLSIVDSFGYIGVFILILIENVFPPIPSEAVLVFGGAMTTTTTMNVPVTILAATAGSVIGAMVLYAIGSKVSHEKIKGIFAGPVGKALFVRPDHIEKAEDWFIKYEGKAVLICRCVPLVRSLISIPAGMAHMNFTKFIVLTAIGSSIWNTTLVAAGAWLGESWEKALPIFDKYSYLAFVAFGVIGVGLFVAYLIARKRKKGQLRQQTLKSTLDKEENDR